MNNRFDKTLNLPNGAKPRRDAQQSSNKGDQPKDQRVQLDGHSKRLRDLQKAGHMVSFWMASGVEICGKILGFDKYTVMVETSINPKGEILNNPMVVTFFKAAMEGFSGPASQ